MFVDDVIEGCMDFGVCDLLLGGDEVGFGGDFFVE